MSAPHTAQPDPSHRILGEIIATIGSTGRSAEVLVRTTQTLASALPGAAALAYRWHPDRSRLVLAAGAAAGGAELECQLGEGLIGRAAMTADGSLSGTVSVTGVPRGRGQLTAVAARASAVAARIATREGELLGSLCLVLESRSAPAAWTPQLVVDAARLVGLAIEHEQLSATSSRSADLLGAIELLALSITAQSSLAETLSDIAAMALRTGRSGACAIYMAERGQAEMRLMALAPRGAELPPAWRGGFSWDRQQGESARPIATGHSGGPHREGASLPRSVLAAPAIVGTERVGAVVMLDDSERSHTDAEMRLCERIARLVAVAIRQRRLLDGTIERTRSEDLLWEVVGPGSADRAAVLARAQRLGCDLSVPRFVIAAAITQAAPAERLRAAIAAIDRSAIVDAAGDRLIAIVSPDTVDAIHVGPYSIGVSQVTRELGRYPLAYRQAQEALELGIRLFGHGRIVRFEDLGSYRFVPALIQCGLTAEAEYQQVTRLSDDLLRTLEAYLDCGGNTALAAKQMFLHRNTLRQRLERISAALEIDLAAPSRWLPLQLAIKTARMSRLAPPPASGSTQTL